MTEEIFAKKLLIIFCNLRWFCRQNKCQGAEAGHWSCWSPTPRELPRGRTEPRSPGCSNVSLREEASVRPVMTYVVTTLSFLVTPGAEQESAERLSRIANVLCKRPSSGMLRIRETIRCSDMSLWSSRRIKQPNLSDRVHDFVCVIDKFGQCILCCCIFSTM